MGFYLPCKQDLDKAGQLVTDHFARLEAGPYFDPTGKRVGICVVQNGAFDAAGIAFSQEEANVFAGPDSQSPHRRRTWLSLPRETIIELCPSVEKFLPKLQP